jgi:hypothetical protein
MGVKPPSTSHSNTRPKEAVALSIPESKFVIKLEVKVRALGSQGSENINVGLLGCNAAWTCT